MYAAKHLICFWKLKIATLVSCEFANSAFKSLINLIWLTFLDIKIEHFYFQHLESAPKEILGDFPRFTREAAAALVFKTEAKHKGWDNFDDEMPDHLRNQVFCFPYLCFRNRMNYFCCF